ncbi:MAG: TonB-dependent receptor plug domain-containing protein [Pyrinomonadaceae bacterium]
MDAGKAVANQGIRLVSANDSFETKTDADGRYSFGNIADGRYLLVYRNKQASVNVANGQVSVANLADVVQISAGATQTVEQVSKTVDVIDGPEMRDRADFALIESLRTIPGFRVAQSGGFGRVATIKTRGLRNWDTALLIDGIRFRDVTAITGDATAFLSDLTLTSVSKVEVLRGSGSSLYGTNAIGGTIDLQTPTARQGTHGQLSGNLGGLGFGRFRGTLSHGTDTGKFGITAGLSQTTYRKGIDGDDRANNTNVQTRIDLAPTGKTSISGRIFFSDADVRLNTDPDTLGTLPVTNATIINARQGVNFTFDANDPDHRQDSRFFSGQFVANRIVNDKFLISGFYQGLATKRTNNNGPLGAGFQSASTSLFDGTIHTGNVHFNWTPVRESTLTAGYEFESESFLNDGKTPSGTANYFTRAGQNSNTFYMQNLVSLLDGDLQLAGGFRVQQFRLNRPEFSLANAPYNNLTLSNPPTAYTFDGSASYFFLKSGAKLRAHIGNGYRVPSLYERFGSFFNTFPSNAFVAIGDPFLRPEKTIAFDAGVEQNVANDRVRLSGTYFWTRLNDIINYGNSLPNIGTTTRPFGGYQNGKGGTSRGGEFGVKAKATSTTDLFASYTYTDSVQLTPQLTGSGIFKTLGVPDHQFTLVATQRYKRFWVNFDFLATSKYLAPIFSNTTFNSYIYSFQGNRKGDLTAGYTFAIKGDKSLRLYGTIENVFDQEYYENGFRTAGTTGRVGLTFGF